MLEFVLPTRQNRADVLSFYGEIKKSGGTCIGIANYRDYDLLKLTDVRRLESDAVWLRYKTK